MIHRTDLSITHSLIFGCGGRGAGAVHHCRERIIAELFGGNDRLAGFAPLRIFAVDASDQAMNPNHKFGNGELLSVGMGDNPSIHDILDDPIYPRTGGMVKAIGSLFPPKKNYKRQLNNLANARHGMGTCPPIGRMNLLGRWNELYIYLHREIQRTWGGRAPEDYEFPVVDKKTMHVFIVAGLYGGTGAGIHLDLAALTRLVFQDLRIGTPEIYGIFFLADFVPEVQHLEANTYACLKELDHFAAGKPYELFFADGTKRSVANSGADCLFNKIFLINDRNRPVDGDTTILSIDDADRMVGEVLFHWSCTDLGSQILARLRDRPNQKCQEMVSERGKGRGAELRKAAYSTFGFATAGIPYDRIRKNLVCHYCMEVLNDLLCVPDHTTPEELAAVAGERKSFLDKHDPASLLAAMEFTDKEMRRSFALAPSEHITREAKIKKIKDDQRHKSYAETEGFIREEAEAILNKTDHDAQTIKDKKAEYLRKTESKLEDACEALTKEGGPVLAEEALRRLEVFLSDRMKDKREHGVIQLREAIRTQLGQGRELIEKRTGLFRALFNDRSLLNDYNDLLSALAGNLEKLLAAFTTACFNEMCEPVVKLIQGKRKELNEDSVKFDEIRNIIRKDWEVEYTSALLDFNPVPVDKFKKFIDEFPFAPQNVHDSFADRLRKDGIAINDPALKISKKIEVHDFADHPAAVAKAMTTAVQEIIARDGAALLNSTFEASPFYPLIPRAEDDRWRRYAYAETFATLRDRSAPYLQYRNKQGFESISMAFFILPNGSSDDAKGKWQAQDAATDFPPYWYEGTSPFHISALQIHCGLPLYSIDGIGRWKQAYEALSKTDQPLHKFNMIMPEPVAAQIAIRPYTKKEKEELYQWAKQLTKGCVYALMYQYPHCPNLFILNSEELVVKEFFYELYDELFVEKEKLAHFLTMEENFNFREEFLTGFNLIISQPAIYPAIRSVAIEHFQRYRQNTDIATKTATAVAILDDLPDGDYEPFFKIDNNRIHVRQGKTYRKALMFVKNNFYEERKIWKLKDHLQESDVISHLQNDDDFFAAFWRSCCKACEELRIQGEIPPNLPRALR